MFTTHLGRDAVAKRTKQRDQDLDAFVVGIRQRVKLMLAAGVIEDVDLSSSEWFLRAEELLAQGRIRDLSSDDAIQVCARIYMATRIAGIAHTPTSPTLGGAQDAEAAEG